MAVGIRKSLVKFTQLFNTKSILKLREWTCKPQLCLQHLPNIIVALLHNLTIPLPHIQDHLLQIQQKHMFPALSFFLLTLPAIISSIQIHQQPISIPNPLFFDVCQDHSVIVVANSQKIEILTRKGKHYQSLIVPMPFVVITWVKCMKRGFVAIASSDMLCLYNILSSEKKCNTFIGRPLSISEEIETDQQFLLIEISKLQLTQMVYYNYTATHMSPVISTDINIERASYVANHQYIYTVDQLSNLYIYESPYRREPSSRQNIKEVSPVDSISTFRNIQAALLSNRYGDFALIDDGDFKRAWTKTEYKRGCLCSRGKVALANHKYIAIYDSDDEAKIIDGFKLTGELKGIICSFQEQHNKLHLLDGQGKLLILQLQEHQSRPSLYILIFVVLIIAAIAIKFIWFPSRQQMLSTDFDDASKQDQQHAYNQLKQIKDKVREDH